MPAAFPRRRETLAALTLTLVLLHLLLAPLALVLAVGFTAVSRLSRWRLWWLVTPAMAGLVWTVATGPHQALAGFTAWPVAVFGHLTTAGAVSPGGQPTGAGPPLPGQALLALPLALPLAAAEAAIAGWLDWLRTDEWAVRPSRPGLVALVRRAVAGRAVAAGAVVTRSGCALGVVPATGAVAELSWAEARLGVLVTASAEQAVTVACQQVVLAALRRRKPVIVLDPGPDSDVAAFLAAACGATGTPLRPAGRGDSGPGYSPGPGHTGGASQLWERRPERSAFVPPRADACPDRACWPQAELPQVVSERLAVLLPAATAELAAAACAQLRALAGDLRRIGVDGDALVWVPQAERLAGSDLFTLVRDGAATGLAVLAGTTTPGRAAELTEAFGTVLAGPVSDREMAAGLAGHTGTRLLPPPVAALLGGERPAAGDDPAGTLAAPDLVPSPTVPAPALLALAAGEFVLAVTAPAPRLVAPGRLIPARLPQSAPPPAPGGNPAPPVLAP